MTQDVLAYSRSQKHLADELLENSKIVEFLSKFGEVRVVGSYSYDLMTASDIDIHVIVPKLSRKSAMEAFNELMDQGFFYAYKIADFNEKAKRPGIDRGYLIGLRYWSQEEKWSKRWKFDIWFLENENPKVIKLENDIKNKLMGNKIRTILEIKFWRDNYNTGIESYIIYDAVLNQNVNSLKEFQDYLETLGKNC